MSVNWEIGFFIDNRECTKSSKSFVLFLSLAFSEPERWAPAGDASCFYNCSTNTHAGLLLHLPSVESRVPVFESFFKRLRVIIFKYRIRFFYVDDGRKHQQQKRRKMYFVSRFLLLRFCIGFIIDSMLTGFAVFVRSRVFFLFIFVPVVVYVAL